MSCQCAGLLVCACSTRLNRQIYVREEFLPVRRRLVGALAEGLAGSQARIVFLKDRAKLVFLHSSIGELQQSDILPERVPHPLLSYFALPLSPELPRLPATVV